jgi:hypothetical protein
MELADAKKDFKKTNMIHWINNELKKSIISK